ncbi:MAG: hypothetical protein KF774_19805 [Planctomyces sp.]|nr:hypothetical protein [Planctomyces sp.]
MWKWPFEFDAVAATLATCLLTGAIAAAEEPLRPVRLVAAVDRVQPMTGIVLWDDADGVETDAIQLEFSYLRYDEIVRGAEEYDWSVVDRKLEAIAGRGHQAIFRFYDTYPGRESSAPRHIKALPDYRETNAPSEGQPTGFPDWSHAGYQQFVLEFYDRFAERYDDDPRLAFLQVGFGLWSEYHIYDGPEILGRTFPSKEFQAEFLKRMAERFPQTAWMISIDAADADRTPLANTAALRSLPFGLFDDSLLCREHARENEPNWNVFGRDRWRRAPAGGEFSYYTEHDQQQALAPRGPHGVPFERAAAKFHISFVIGSDQPQHAGWKRIREAGLACGYRIRVERFESADGRSLVVVANSGVAPIYYDAWPAVDGVRSETSLRGLLPGERREFRTASGGAAPRLTIECDRLSPGQAIGFDAQLTADGAAR